MFTGIVEEIAPVVALDRPTAQDARLAIATTVAADAAPGSSIAVNGVCLTVLHDDDAEESASSVPGVGKGQRLLAFDVMPQTLALTGLGGLQAGDSVNIERALAATDRFNGHVVQGHVDGIATLASREPGPRWDALRFTAAPDLLKYVVPQGSITIDGVSLTVTGVDGSGFSVALIPTTLERTTLGELPVGGRVNIEVDALAKYAAHLLSETSGTDGAASSSSETSAQRFFTPSLTKIAEATLPTNYGEFQVAAFRDGYGVDHAVLIAPGSDESALAPLVRVHSECLTGDALGSLRCDCGPQLHSAMAEVGEAGGAIIYLRGHEGRGIGLAAKIAAYSLQDDGLDTVEANRYLGLPVDARDYSVAADILRTLEMSKIRLLTNNPEKSEALSAAGIEVLELVPLVVGLTAANLNYLETKRDRMGHLLTLDEQSEIE